MSMTTWIVIGALLAISRVVFGVAYGLDQDSRQEITVGER
jgi:membrane-associated phospholipid phosphatase